MLRPDSPRWVEVTPSEHTHEHAGLAAVRERLPDTDPFRAWSNFTFTATDGRLYEVDLLVIGRGGLHLVELKHWTGQIRGDQRTWWHGGVPKDNPRLLANAKAQRLASLLREVAHDRGVRAKVPYVTASVLLHASDATVTLDALGRTSVYGLDHEGPAGLPGVVAGLLAAPPRDERDAIDRATSKALARLLEATGLRRSARHRTVGTVLLDEDLLAEGPGWQDYLGRHTSLEGVYRRVRFYLVQRAASAEQRATIGRAARREFAVLEGINHPGIARAVDFVDHERGPAVVFEHNPAETRLDHFLAENGAGLGIDAQIDIVRTLAQTLRHAHGRRLVHRRLSPRSVAVQRVADGRLGVRVRDWQTSGRLVTSTTHGTHISGTRHLDELTDPGAAPYLAPEGHVHPDADGVLLDVFGLGAIAYLVFTGEPPASGTDDLLARLGRDGGLDVTADIDAPQAMRDLVFEATVGEVDLRTETAAAFVAGLDRLVEELTAPEPAEDVDPLDARPDDVLATPATPRRFQVVARLGRGSTAQALLVTDLAASDGNRGVLKVALDEDKRYRLVDEAEVLTEVRDPRVAAMIEGPLTVGGRTALLLEDAGRESLADLLRREGRLSIDLLERWGTDLLEVARALDLVGVNHRDVKPDNLAHREIGKRRERHLTLFDFSLSRAPLEETKAGTPPYLDPFFGPARPRWDAAAERYAVAVTLYEMATGAVPLYGDGASHPSLISDDVTIDPELFDPAIADGLAAFFGPALARDPAGRYDTVTDMLRAWRDVFSQVPEAAAEPSPEPVPGEDRDALAEAATPATPLAESGLTPRAVSALSRRGLATVGDLVDLPAMEVTRLSGLSEATRREIRRRAKRWRERLAPAARTAAANRPVAPEPDEAATGGASVDAVLATLLPAETARAATEARVIRAVLFGLGGDRVGGDRVGRDGTGRHGVGGHGTGRDGAAYWPTQAAVAAGLGVSRQQVSRVVGTWRGRWRRSVPLAAVRDAVAALLDDAGGVASAEEIALAVLAARGSAAEDAERLARGIAVVRAAVEAELDEGGEARLDFRRVGDRVLLAREPDDPQAPPAAVLTDYATALGSKADLLASDDPLPSAARCHEVLAAVPLPDGVGPLPDERLATVAAAASRTAAATSRGEIYPVGLDPVRALRQLASTFGVLRHGLDVRQMAGRVRGRYPRAAPLPDIPDLDAVVAQAGLPLRREGDRYVPLTASSSEGLASATRFSRTRTRLTEGAPLPAELADLERRLEVSLAERGFLTLTVDRSRLLAAPRALAVRFGATPYDVTAALLAAMRRVAERGNVDWELVLRADRPDAPARDAANLRRLVAEAAPEVERHLATTPEALAVTGAEPLARYGRLAELEHLADAATARPAARWLIVAAERVGALPHLDGAPAPTTSGWLRLPSSWVDHVLRTTAGPSAGRAS